MLSAQAQASSNAQRVVDAWQGDDGDRWVFYADGRLVRGDSYYRYGVSENLLMIKSEHGSFVAFNYVFSPDGETMFLGTMGGMHGHVLQKTR